MKQKGSIIIFTLFLLAFIINIAMGLLNVFIPKLKTLQEASYSVRALYAADTAAELCLYEARTQPATAVPRTTPPGSPPNYGTILTNGSIFTISSLSASPVNVVNDCRPLGVGDTFKFRATGQYKGVARSLEVSQ